MLINTVSRFISVRETFLRREGDSAPPRTLISPSGSQDFHFSVSDNDKYRSSTATLVISRRNVCYETKIIPSVCRSFSPVVCQLGVHMFTFGIFPPTCSSGHVENSFR